VDQRSNRAAVVKLFRQLLNEAWKADLNFIAPSPSSEFAKLSPHQRLQVEEAIAAEKEQKVVPLSSNFGDESYLTSLCQEKTYSFEIVKDLASKGLTVFRMADFDLPNLESIRQSRERAQQLLREVRANL
jgi:hypothetical protein